MNDERRKRIDSAITKLENIQQKLVELYEEIDGIQSDEQDAFDNMPESLQGADKGTSMEESIRLLESAVDNVKDFADSTIDDIVSELRESKHQ